MERSSSLFTHLLGKKFHTDGSTGENVTSADDGTDDAAKRRFEWKILLEGHIQKDRVFSFFLLE